MSELRHWPVLLVAGLLLAAGVGLEAADTSDALATALVVLSAACIGAFLYAEGSMALERRRRLRDERDRLA